MFPLESNFSKILIYSFQFTSLGASDTGLGASGAELGASGLCVPLESNFSNMLVASDLELGASDVELGATDLDLTVEGSSFPNIQKLYCWSEGGSSAARERVLYPSTSAHTRPYTPSWRRFRDRCPH